MLSEINCYSTIKARTILRWYSVKDKIDKKSGPKIIANFESEIWGNLMLCIFEKEQEEVRFYEQFSTKNIDLENCVKWASGSDRFRAFYEQPCRYGLTRKRTHSPSIGFGINYEFTQHAPKLLPLNEAINFHMRSLLPWHLT